MNTGIRLLISGLLCIALFGFLGGHFQSMFPKIPALGKLLSPMVGVWHSGFLKDQQDLELYSDVLTAEVEISYDDRWVPHVYAQNLEDLIFAQGYVEASNRLFQMDFIARAAAGELSAVLGEVTVAEDVRRHRSGILRAAENTVEGWKKFPKEYDLVLRYTAGVNHYISQLHPAEYPLEYKLLNATPEQWTPLKSALIFKYMSEILAGRADDVRATNARQFFGKETFDFLYPERLTNDLPIVRGEDKNWSQSVPPPLPEEAIVNMSFPNQNFESPNKNIGSNNWVINGKKSESGFPILCNDPHLSLSLPSIWFEEQLSTPEFSAYGVSFPGVAGIMIGFNEHIAWGETNVGQDINDLYLINWENRKKGTYMVDGKILQASFDIKEIKVKNKPSLLDTVVYTVFGPIQYPSKDGKADLARRWLASDVPAVPDINVFIQTMMSTSEKEFSEAISIFQSPAQNFIFAHNAGDIALTVNGTLPVKGDQDGRFVKNGNTTAYDWKSFIPRDQLPKVLNPERNYILSANQRSVSSNFPYYFTGKFEDFRNHAVDRLLQDTSDRLSPIDMKVIQTNNYSVKASYILPQLQTIVNEDQHPIIQKLKSWNYEYNPQESAASYFDYWFDQVYDLSLDEVLEEEKNQNLLSVKDMRLIEIIKESPNHPIFDIKTTKDIKENAQTVIKIAFEKTKSHFDSLKTEQHAWGKYRPTEIKHLLKIPALSSQTLELGGSPDVINAIGKEYGPSWRMIVHLSTPVEAYGVYPGGQSGNPTSPHYLDMLEPWSKNEYFRLNLVPYLQKSTLKTTQITKFKPSKS